MNKASDTDRIPLEGRDLDDLIRRYREAEAKKEEEKKKSTDVEPEMSSFILQHYDRVLLLERNEAAGEAAFRLLKAEGYNIEWETERDSAIEILQKEEFSTLIVSEGFSADGLLIQETLKEKGIQVNLRIIKDFGTAILGHEETASLKNTRRSFYHLLDFTVRFLESFHLPMVGHAKEVSRLAREVAIRMELLPEIVDGITVTAYLHEMSELHERYVPYWQKSEDIFQDMELKLPEWHVRDLTQALQYPYPVADSLKRLQERYDGKGYPDGLKGEEIPIAARIIAPIDIYMNMISGEMGPAMSRGEAIDQLILDSGIAFDPAVIEILVGILKQELAERDGTEYRETILMVDNFGDDDLVKIQLREEGYRVISADSMQNALVSIERDKPFMIISDIDLKSGSGFQLLDSVRKKTEFREIPFIIMSSKTDTSFISKGIRAGADDYIPRPCSSDLLLAKIARTIARTKGRGA
ncbi:response regulator, partial [bacterium]|nr:response regulator [candidate division CSSED10-310 bacterium]